MDFSIKYEDVDGAIRQFRSGIQRLEDSVKVLKNDISQFNGGGFQGQSGDKMTDLIDRKIGRLEEALLSTDIPRLSLVAGASVGQVDRAFC